MSDNSKPYAAILKQIYDKQGKMVALDFLTSTGLAHPTIPLEEQPERFKEFDNSYCMESGKLLKVEAEVKDVWNVSGAWLSYTTVDVGGRKADTQCDVFIMSNHHQDTIAVIQGEDLRHAKERNHTRRKATFNKVNGQRTQNELFLALPLNYVKFFHKFEDGWKRIKPDGQLVKD
ncbi:MAG: hypothetical protein M0R80_02015 [Proteobacteria bacterium]|jgi:hypothetical protein|nr:hypothetical protein [Pseudomonadota bacterium]